MVEKSTDLDSRRGMAAQKATELRRLRSAVEADHAALRARRDELEAMLAAHSAASWPDAVEKARYLIGLLAETSAAQDPRRRKLIADLLDEFDRLLAAEPPHDAPSKPE